MNTSNKDKQMPGVGASAHVVNCFRAKHPEISLDKFAHLWISEPAVELANHYLEKVGETEADAHCLRHRFFLESLRAFCKETKEKVFINIGAGFTNYPHLINANIPCCEVDKPNIINAKQRRLQELQASGQIPKRDILFLPIDDIETSNARNELFKLLTKWTNKRKSFVLMEGLI
ncbi:MAG: hypothetical protein GY914_07130 [Prochlorococcus sp.]|nr:hypothetical protein [Prochlorococcus sp.]